MKRYSLKIASLMLALAVPLAAMAEPTTVAPGVPFYVQALTFDLLKPTKTAAPMQVIGGFMTTPKANKGASLTTFTLHKGTYVLDFLVNAPSTKRNAMAFSLVPYPQGPGHMRLLEFKPTGIGGDFQRVRGTFVAPADGTYLLYLQGVETGVGVSKLRIMAADATEVVGGEKDKRTAAR